MGFKKKMQQRRTIAISYMALGLVLIVTDIIKQTGNYFFSSFGIALILMGILRLFRYRKITSSDQTMRRQEVAESDERTRMIAERARSWAFSLSITGAGIAVIVLSLLGHHDEAMPFSWYVCGMVVLYWISFFIVRRKY